MFVVVLGEEPMVNVPEPVAFAIVSVPELDAPTPNCGVTVQVGLVALPASTVPAPHATPVNAEALDHSAI